ncbi:MAG: hypothetical protein IJX05_02665, partial [Clostridia bacterium]|nr:hypothetical protein [Clostridia bacterium]
TIAIFLVIALFVSLVVANYTFSSGASTKIVSAAELKEYNISQQHDQLIKSYARMPTLDDDFDDDEITIILDGEHSGTGIGNSSYNFDEVLAELKKVDNIDINSVEELFELKEGVPVLATYRRMLIVKLKTPGKDKIIEAIKQLQELDMVLAAEPKYNRYAVND